MANPRQRRKARSSSYKPVSQSKHSKRNLKKTPPIRGPKVLQQAWNKHKTVRQNYVALGLVHDLNPTESGGTEIMAVDDHTTVITDSTSGSTGSNSEAMTEPSTLNSFSTSERSTASNSQARTEASNASAGPSSNTLIPKGYGKIIRDENGNLLDVQLAEGESEGEVPDSADNGDVDMEHLSPELEESVRKKWVSDLGGKSGASVGKDSSVVKKLEKLSVKKTNGRTLGAPISGVGARHASEGEKAYFARLVEKYGTDVERMARDRKLNSGQRTAGELWRGLARAGMLS